MGNPMETTDYIILIGNTIYTYIHLWESVEYVLRGDMQWGEILLKDAFLYRASSLTQILGLKKTVVRKIRASETVLKTKLKLNSPNCMYIS